MCCGKLAFILVTVSSSHQLCSGDEYGHTRHGNNNWYGHDSQMTHFDWKPDTRQQEFCRFYASLIKFRKSCPLLGRDAFLRDDDITWHEAHWENEASKFIAFTLHGRFVSTSRLLDHIKWGHCVKCCARDYCLTVH